MPHSKPQDSLADDRLLSRADVLRMTTLSDGKHKQLVREGKFPPPVEVTEHRVAWRLSDVRAWIDMRQTPELYRDAHRKWLASLEDWRSIVEIETKQTEAA